MGRPFHDNPSLASHRRTNPACSTFSLPSRFSQRSRHLRRKSETRYSATAVTHATAPSSMHPRAPRRLKWLDGVGGNCHRQVQRLRHTYAALTAGTMLAMWYRGCPASRNVGSLQGDWLISRAPVSLVTRGYILRSPLSPTELILACKATFAADVGWREDLGLRTPSALLHGFLDDNSAHMFCPQEEPVNFEVEDRTLSWFSDFPTPG